MGTWRDGSRIDWLIENVPSKVDRVGPSAFDALTQLDEAAAFECLRTADPFDLSPTRSWWLPRLLLRSPETVEQKFSDEIQRRSGREVDHLLSVFQSHEDEMPPRLVDLLLDRLEEQLGEALRDTDPEKHHHHMIEFGMLTMVARRDAFECFRRRRESELEQQLRDWLLQIPINNSNWHSGEHNDGLGVLARIGGQGFSDVLNHWLENGQYWGRWLCWKFASRRYDARTIKLLCMRSRSVEMHPGSELVLEDSKAAQALAALDQWDPVCRYVRKAKAKVQSDVAAFQPDATEFSEPLLDELRNGDTQDPGTIGGMGFTGRAEFRNTVIKTLNCATPDSDLARVCALALDDLGDNSPDSVPLLAQLLGTAQNEFAASRTLLRSGSVEAIDALVRHVETEPWFNESGGYTFGGNWLLLTLLRLPNCPQRAVDKAASMLRELGIGGTRAMAAASILQLVASRDIGDELAGVLITQPEVQEFVSRNAFGSGRAGIQLKPADFVAALAHINAVDAAISCKRFMADHETDDHHRLPDLLLKCDPHQAADWLGRHAVKERNTRVLWQIGRALKSLPSADVVDYWRGLVEPNELAAVCLMLTYHSPDSPIDEWLLTLLESPSSLVVDAAALALRRRRQQVTLGPLIQDIATESDLPFRWLLLEGIALIADPCDEECSLRKWMTEIGPVIPRAMCKWLNDELKSSRKKLLEDAKNWDDRLQ